MSCECEDCGKVSIISNITLCEDCYRKEIEASKKQGALEELEKLLGRLKIGGFIDKEHLWEMIENRIKELEKELLK